MPEVQNEVEHVNVGSAKISIEIVLIYAMTGIIALTFFDSIKILLYSSLGYITLAMFLSVAVVMIGYTLFNFTKGLLLLLSR